MIVDALVTVNRNLSENWREIRAFSKQASMDVSSLSGSGRQSLVQMAPE